VSPAQHPARPSTRPPEGGLASIGELTSAPYATVLGIRHEKTPILDRRKLAASQLKNLSADLAGTQDKLRRARLHFEIARLNEVVLDDLNEASAHYKKSHKLDAGFEPTVAGLIRVRSLSGKWEATLPLYDEQVALSANPEDKAGLLFCKAVILEARLNKPQEARAAYVEALKFAPSEAALLRSVARVARRDKDFKALDAFLAAQARVGERDKNYSAAYAAERARMAELHGSKNLDPVEIYQQSFDIDPLASAAIVALERLYASSNRAREHVGVLGRRAELVTNPASRASALASAGALLAESLGEASEAAFYYEQAWRAQPENLGILRELEELYRKCGNFEGAVSVLGRLEQGTRNNDERAGLCVRIAELLHRRMGRREDAVKYWERARQFSPALRGAVEPLVAYYEEVRAWPQLIQVLEQEESASTDSDRRSQIHVRLAYLAEKLRLPDVAIGHYRSALGLRPGDETASRQLSRLLEEASRYEELVEIHQRAVDTARDEAVVLVHLFKIGQVFEDLIKQPTRALPIYRRILDSAPGHLGALFALQRAAERAQEYVVLVEALVEEAGVVRVAERKVPLLHRAGQVCDSLLGQEQRAVKLYTEALTLDKSHGPTLDSFASIHERGGRYPELLKLLTLKFASLGDQVARSALQFRMGRICEEHLRQDDAALGHFRKAVEATPGSSEASLAVERCLIRLSRHEELAELLEARASTLPSGADRAEAALSWGRVLEMRLGRLGPALNAYEMALSDVPDHERALDAQVRVLERIGDADKAAQAHGERALASTDGAVRLWARLRKAEILDSTYEGGEAAISAYEAVLAENPHHPAALGALGRLYEQAGAMENLGRILRLQASNMADTQNQVGAYRELLRLFESSADETTHPVATPSPSVFPELAAALLEHLPGDRPALRHAELFALKHRNEELLAAVDQRYARLTSQAQLASAHQTRLGEYLESRNVVQALAQHRPALALDQENIGAARGIGRVAEHSENPTLLAEAAEIEAKVARDPARAAELLSEGARLLSSLGNTDGAVTYLLRALVLFPDSLQAAAGLHQLLSDAGRFEELGAALSTAAQACQSTEALVQHWIAVAKIMADQNGDVPAAIAALQRVELSGAKSLDCHLELADLLLRDRQWKPAVEQLERAVALEPSEQMLVNLRLRLAEIYHEQMGKTAEATRQLSAVIELAPSNLEALRRLLSIQMKGENAGALKTAQALAEFGSGILRAKAQVAIGTLLVQARRPQEAKEPFAAAVSVLGLEPPEAADGLRAILVKEALGPDSWAIYTRALSAFVAVCPVGESLDRAYLELGRTLADRQQAGDEAASVLSAGLLKNPAAQTLRSELVQRLRAQGRYQEALPHVLSLTRSSPLDAAKWAELVDVYASLGKNAEAHLATGPLVHLGGGSELQRSSWSSRSPRAAMVYEGAFDAEALTHTLDQTGLEHAVALLVQITGPLSKVYPTELSNFGASARNKVSAKGNHPCRPALDRLCHSFGGIEIDLYPSDTAESIHVVLTDPIGLVIPTSLMGMTDVEQVFYMGRFVANIGRNTAIADVLSENDFRVAFAAAMEMVELRSIDPKVDSAELTLITRRLQKAMPWLSKGRIEDAARRYGASPLHDVEEFRHQLKIAAFRTALVLSDDLGPLFKLTKGNAPMVGLKAEEADALLSEVLPYWGGRDAMALRQRLGLL
jgi:tetratricopeptide (TPR) repeat protein